MSTKTAICLIVMCMTVTVFGQSSKKNAKEIKKLQTQNKELQEAVSQLQSKVNHPPVFFTGMLKDDVHTPSPYDQVVVLVFDDLITQSGNAYDQSTGVFTAPVKGVYVASVTAITWRGETGSLWFEHNNNDVAASTYAAKSDYNYNSGSSTATVLLEAGDTFKVMSGGNRLYIYFTSFSIHLAYAV